MDKIDKVDKDKDHQSWKGLHFKDLDNTQEILDLVLYQILGIIFLMQDSGPSQDLIPDLDLEVSTNQLNDIIVIVKGIWNDRKKYQYNMVYSVDLSKW